MKFGEGLTTKSYLRSLRTRKLGCGRTSQIESDAEDDRWSAFLRKYENSFNCLRLGLVLAALCSNAVAQVPPVRPHGFGALSPQTDGSIALELVGQAPNAYKRFFDLYLLESSTDLVHWEPLATVLRTNASTNSFVYLVNQGSQPNQFFRTATNHLFTQFFLPTGPYRVGSVMKRVNSPTR